MNNQIVQVDWNGMVTHVWEVGQEMTSGFCIDQDRYLYCIKKESYKMKKLSLFYGMP